MEQRDCKIDILKGFGMILVIFAHIYQGELNRIIYLFHMPLFVIATGCVLHGKNHLSILKLSKRILIPYFVFSLLSFSYWAVFESHYRELPFSNDFFGLFTDSPKIQQFCNIFVAKAFDNSFAYNVVLWYLPSLFVARLIYNSFQGRYKGLEIFCIIICISVQLLVAPNYTLPFELELSCIFVLLFYIGRTIYPYLNKYCYKNWTMLSLFAVSFFSFYFLNSSTHTAISFVAHIFPPFYLFYAFAILGFFIIYALSFFTAKIELLKHAMIWVGKNSLILMCIHEPIKRIVIKLFEFFANQSQYVLRNDFIYSSVIFAFLLLLLVPITIIVDKKLPWVIGKN